MRGPGKIQPPGPWGVSNPWGGLGINPPYLPLRLKKKETRSGKGISFFAPEDGVCPVHLTTIFQLSSNHLSHFLIFLNLRGLNIYF